MHLGWDLEKMKEEIQWEMPSAPNQQNEPVDNWKM